MFLPTTRAELHQLGWQTLDIILVTGDTYIDTPFIGAALIGSVLRHAGYKVGMLAQPDIHSAQDITRLGEPALFWGVTGGSVDSMVANYTALRKKRKSDDFTPGGINNRRPDRAVIVYSNLIRRNFKNTVPIVLGGIEASLRRIAHYDFWSDKIRRSILLDAKADYLIYGMGEKTILALAQKLEADQSPCELRGLCYISSKLPDNIQKLPSFDQVQNDKKQFTQMFHRFYRNNDPVTGETLAQQYDNRWLIQNPPAHIETQQELDAYYNLDFERKVHPFYAKQGKVRALDTIQFSITSHRGCYGECNFCAIAMHQGRTTRWRSEASVLKEVHSVIKHAEFKGTINDIGGPTGNMYGFECERKRKNGACPDKNCLTPEICPSLKPTHGPQLHLLKKIRNIKEIKHVFMASGLRYDLILEDNKLGQQYLREILLHHTSGQLKIAPEHTDNSVLGNMNKPGKQSLIIFKNLFDSLKKKMNSSQGAKNDKVFLTYYFIAGHPGCAMDHMQALQKFIGKHLKINPEQVQIFTPTPSTYSSLMYYTERDPWTGKKIFVEKKEKLKRKQKEIITRRTTW